MESIDDMRKEHDEIVKRGMVPALRCQTGTHKNTIPIRREGQKNQILSVDGLKHTCMSLQLVPLTQISKTASNPNVTGEGRKDILSKVRELAKSLSVPMNGCNCQLISITKDQSDNTDYIGVHPHSLR